MTEKFSYVASDGIILATVSSCSPPESKLRNKDRQLLRHNGPFLLEFPESSHVEWNQGQC